MKKRILSILLTFCMVMGLVPITVFAEDTRYGVWIMGEEITSSRKTSREGWEFDPNTYTLTLRNFQIGTIGTKIPALFDKYSLFGLIYVDTSVHDLTIRLEGKESYLGDEEFPNENCTKYKEAYYGIYAPSTNLTITGNRGAILKIQTHENAIECKNLTIKDSVTVEAVSQGTCIYACGDITIEGAGTLVNARTTDIIKGQAAMSTRGKLYVGENSYLVTCSVAKSSSWERVGFLHNLPNSNCISSLYVGGVATVDGGIVTAYFYKRSGSYINEYDYSIEDFGETKAFYCKRLDIDNGGEVNVFFTRAEGKKAQNEYGFYTSDVADSWEDLRRGCIYFQGDGVMRVGMANGKRVENAISIPDNRVAIAGPHVKMTRTAYVNPPQLYSEYSDFVELTGKKHNSITLFSEKRGGGDMPFWSYYTDKSDASYIDGTLALKDIVASDLELKLTAEPGTYTVDPLVNAGCAIPEMVVQSGAALKLTTQQWGNYAFTKPIRLEGGSLEIDGTTANITGLDIRGTGTVTFNGGTVSGTVEKSVQVVINGGNIDVPDYGNTVDGDGNAVHKFVYTVETEERYTQPLQIKTMTGSDKYDTVSLRSGLFHRGENNERLLYLWLDRSDRVLRLRVNDPNENEHKDCLALRFGTNVFTEGPHLNMRSNETVMAREGERLTLSAIENQTPTDMQNQYVKEVLWFLSTDGGQTFRQIGYSYGNMGGVNYDYTIPNVTKEQNGYIYRAKVTYRNGEDVWGGTMETYTYDATIYMDQPELRAPERYVAGQTAKFEVVHPTLPEGIRMKYFWQTSKDGESWGFAGHLFGESNTYEPEITADMEGMQVRVVVQTWKNNSWTDTTILGPVTIHISESIPVITEHPKDGVTETPEQPKPAKPGEITIVFGRQHLFKVTASGSDIKYQWQISSDNGRTFVDIPGETTDSTGLNVGKENNGKLVRCVVSNEYGTAVSNVARLTVYYQPKFNGSISDTTVNVGEKATFTMPITEGNPGGVEVNWQVSRDGGTTYADVTEADGTASLSSETVNGENVWTTTFVTCEATTGLNGNVYRCIAGNAKNDDYVGTWRSDAATLTVNSYTVNYDTDGGSKVGSKTLGWTDKVLDGVATPSKNGYDFIGWKYGDITVPADTPYSALAADDSVTEITLTALWREKDGFAVRFHSDGGSEIADKTNVKWNDKVLDGVATPSKNGYDFIGWKYGDITVTADTLYSDLAANDSVKSITLTAQWKDTEKPTGTIAIDKNQWNSFLNNITFGLFFKETQTVTITAADNSGKAVKIEYLLSGEKLTESELTSAAFTAYDGAFNINPDNEYIVYVRLTDEAGNVAYICSDGIVLDGTAPVIGGIENGKVYCEAQTVTIDEKYIDTVTVNGTAVTLDEKGSFILAPATGEQTIVVTDKAGNTAQMTVTVNDGHTALADDGDCTTPVYCQICNAEVVAAKQHDFSGAWLTDESSHWHACQNENCTVTDTKVAHSGNDDGDCTTAVVCKCGYVCTAAQPAHTWGEWVSNENGTHTRRCTVNGCTAGVETGDCADADHDHQCDTCDYVLSECTDADHDHHCDLCGKELSPHTGGKATCTAKAVCEVCGEPYGELDADNHTNLQHIPAKAATEEAAGNIEYWYCAACGAYFADEAGTQPIIEQDTVIARLEPTQPEPTKPTIAPSLPQTGDSGHPLLWFALLFVSGGVLTGAAAFGKKKKHNP